MTPAEGLLAAILQLSMTFTLAATSGATCIEQQVSSCRKAALDGTLSEVSGGGECKVSPYVQYTHECRVKDFLPNVDFCCCELDKKVMCCRYQQYWDRFRCSEAADTIHQISSTSLPLPLEILVPAVLGPLVVIGCCIFCCIKCLCHRCYYYEDEDSRDCFANNCCHISCADCCSCASCCSSDENQQCSRDLEKNGRLSSDEQVPLTYPNLMQQTSHTSGDSGKLLHFTIDGRVQPTAPPSDDVFVQDYTQYNNTGNNVGNNNPSDIVPQSSIYATPHALCPSCSSAIQATPQAPPPPPTYEESQDHAVAQGSSSSTAGSPTV